MYSVYKAYDSFEDFWDAISPLVKVRNHPTYHPCCRVWTSRRQSHLKHTHSKSMSWGQVLKEAGCSLTEPAALLKSHMLENNWGLPIHLNDKCQFSQSPAYRDPPSTKAMSLHGAQVSSEASFSHQPLQVPFFSHSTAPQHLHQPPELSTPTLAGSNRQQGHQDCDTKFFFAQEAHFSSGLDKRLDSIEAKLLKMVEHQADHESHLNQKLANLPLDFHRVREKIDANTTEQRSAAKTLDKLRWELLTTDKHVGHVHALVDNLRDKSLDSRQLVQEILELTTALQKVKAEHRTTRTELADCTRHLQDMQTREEQFLQQIERLKTENAGLRLEKHSREVLDQFRREQLNPANPQPYEFKTLLDSDYKIKKKN